MLRFLLSTHLHSYFLCVCAHSIAIFAAALALACSLEIVIFSPARRASRKLLERIVEFVRLLGHDDRIVEYNQECVYPLWPRFPYHGIHSTFSRRVPLCTRCFGSASSQEQCRVKSLLTGRTSLIRSFPSKVSVMSLLRARTPSPQHARERNTHTYYTHYTQSLNVKSSSSSPSPFCRIIDYMFGLTPRVGSERPTPPSSLSYYCSTH